MSPVPDMLRMGGNIPISKLCTPCMFDVEVYVNFGCRAHRELIRWLPILPFYYLSFSSWHFQPFKAIVYISSPQFRPFSAQMNRSNSRMLTHRSSLIYSESILRFGNMACCQRFSCFQPPTRRTSVSLTSSFFLKCDVSWMLMDFCICGLPRPEKKFGKLKK
jgi:hypothetical protein